MDHRLRFPLSVASFYLEMDRKEILTESLACMLECMLEDAIFDAERRNPQGMIEKQDVPILENALKHTKKILEEIRNP